MRLLSQRPRLRRSVLTSVTGLAAAAALGLSGPAASTSGGAAATDDCPGGLSTARVGVGHAHGTDPNSVTAAEASRMNAQLQRMVDQLKAAQGLRADGLVSKQQRFTVRTHVHVITRADGTGGVTRQQIAQQMAVINAGYAGDTAYGAAATPFRFKLVSTDYTANDAWYDWNLTPDQSDEDAEAKAAKRALHRGGWADLNVYIAGLGGGLLGYANFPQDGVLALDGLVLLNDSLPGGAAAPYNLGDTATHEIGHWLGLYHTFENGCRPPGDFVSDTPYQADGDNIFFCNESDDTCPKKGLDPVHNFMSYGDDLCLDQFTKGQARRMTWTWQAFRLHR